MLHLVVTERINGKQNKGAKERTVRSWGRSEKLWGTQRKMEHGCSHNALEDDIANEHPSLYNLWLIDRN